ncbi:acyl carrier protein [Mycobacteroides sp. LB1]|uniref:acyl carrier protein n=1 Tax=Mycobacteroides sp. LB1 TaxID=2750814 RepID=UPI0015DF06AF|nr:acyl carrier protein [Mycobacteroides sp. LB1]
MSTDVAEKLEKILRGELAVSADEITRDRLLIDDLGLDSVGFALGLVLIEEQFGVTLTEDQLLVCDSFGDLVDMVSDGQVKASTPTSSALAE